MMSTASISNYIINGDVSTALKLVKAVHQNDENIADAYILLGKVYSLCYNRTKGKCSPDNPNAVFELTDVLCQTISISWKCDQTRFMQVLYHINSYLLQHNLFHARKISEYFFQLKSFRGNSDWKSNEMIVIANLILDFLNKISDSVSVLVSSSGSNSLGSWLDFIFRLHELGNLNKLYKLFIVSDKILLSVHSHFKDQFNNVHALCMTKLARWLNGLILSGKTVQSTGKELVVVLSLAEHVLTYVRNEKDVAPYTDDLVKFLSKVKDLWVDCEKAIELIVNCVQMLSTMKSKEVVSKFDRLYACVMSRTSNGSLALPTVLNLFNKYRSDFVASSVLIESRITALSRMMLNIYHHCSTEGRPQLKNPNALIDFIYTAVATIACPSVSKENLIASSQDVKTFVKRFAKAVSSLDRDVPRLSLAISAIINASLVYKSAELFDESISLSRYILSIFLKLDPDDLLDDTTYLKNYVEVWLNNSVSWYSKSTVAFEAQIMYIVIASFQPKFTAAAMRSWAALKNSKVKSAQMDATVKDIIDVHGEEIEKQFPEFKLGSVNLDILLLGEVQGYAKFRDLRGEPVLRVYKVASKVVKDRLALANILCCTVDAFSFDTSDTTYFSKLDASVANMTSHLQKFENKGVLEYDNSVLLCTLGNLFYQKVRLLLQITRQKSEKEALEEERWKSKKLMPVIKAGEKDDLDMTEVTMVGSSLKLNQKSDLLPSMELALKYWELAEKTLVHHVVLSPTLSFVKGLGYLLRLNCYKKLEIDCWNLLYRMAKKFESKKYQVLAAAEVLYSSKAVDSSLISEMENLQQSKLFNRKCYVSHLYCINFARNSLLCGKVQECQEAFDKIDLKAVLPHFLVGGQLKILSFLLEMEHSMIGSSKEAPLIPILKLFENLLFVVKNKQWETFNEASVVQILMIDVATILGTIYSDLKHVRYARCYVKADLDLVQKLALPARVCELMALRCWIDLLTWNVTESDCNAQQLESMLDLGLLNGDLSPARMNCRGSPSKMSAVKCVPHFLKKGECNCHNCSDANYPSLVLNAIIIRILILLGNGARLATQQVINIGFSVLEILEQKRLSCNASWTPFSHSIARFYFVVATANFQWNKYKEVSHYATLAYNLLQTEAIKNNGLLINTKVLLLNLYWAQNYTKPDRPIPTSRRLPNVESNECVTPEAQKYVDKKPWDSTVPRNGKICEPGFITHKKVYNRKHLGFEGADSVDNNTPDCVPLVVVTPAGKDADEKTTLGCKFGSKTTDNSEEQYVTARTPENGEVSEVGATQPRTQLKYFTRKRLNVGRSEASVPNPIKLQEDAFSLNGLDSLGVTPSAKEISGKTKTKTHSTRKVQTEKKSKLPIGNLFNNPGISSMSKMVSTTPAIKVFYDPEGLERTGTATCKKATAKKTTRLAALSKGMQDDKFGTPTVSRTTRTVKGKLTFDEDSEDELELVAAPFRKVVNGKFKGKQDRRAGTSTAKKLIHDDTTVIAELPVDGAHSSRTPTEEESPDMVESSILETTLPTKSGRRCIALTSLSIEDQMSKLSLSTKPLKKPTSKEAIPRIAKDSAKSKPREESSRTVKSNTRLKPKS